MDTPIAPIELTLQYRLSVLLVAVVMILLPLLYLALVGAAATAVVLHAVLNYEMVLAGPPLALLYFLPLLVGGPVVLFLFKPIFAPAAAKPPTYSLNRDEEPLLFDFVERLCGCLGAPVPRRIDVTIEPNASASLRRGFLSLFSDDLVLTIGLPLVSSFSTRQLAGVLAHEFAHFTQGSAMRLGYVVGSINSWFARVVLERDAWDEGLERWSDWGKIPALLIFPVRMLIAIGRWILWAMMYVAHIVSCYMSRQMEFDADRHEMQVAGSEMFAATSFDLHVMGIAQAMAYQGLRRSWLESRLGDDFPGMVLGNAQRFRAQPEELKSLKRDLLSERTGLFDTHPSTQQRIARAAAEHCPGLYHVEAPARVLFRDFGGLCQALSLEFYRHELELEVHAENLVPTSQLVAEQAEQSEARRTLYCYFQGEVLGAYELFLPPEAQAAPAAPRQTLQVLKDARQRMLANLMHTKQAAERFEEADDRLRELAHLGVLMEAGFALRNNTPRLRDGRPASLRAVRGEAEQQRAEAVQQLATLTNDARQRMVAALQLLRVPQVARRIQDAETLQMRTGELLEVLAGLERVWPHVLRLRETMEVLGNLMMVLELWDPTLRNWTRQGAGLIADIRRSVVAIPYPFQHAKAAITVAEYALESPPASHPLEVIQGGSEMLDKLMALYYRAMASLAVSAEHVEAAAGLEPLPEPPPRKEAKE